MSDQSKENTNQRFEKLQLLQRCYENQQRIISLSKYISIGAICFAWVLTLFIRFTLPFFIIHTIGTSLWLYYYIATNENLKTRWDYLTDPMIISLSLISIICLIYIIMSASRCSLNGYI